MSSIHDDLPEGFRLFAIARSYPERAFELLLPLPLAEELQEKREERVRIAKAAHEAEEDLRREELRTRTPMARSNSPTCGHPKFPRQDGQIMTAQG